MNNSKTPKIVVGVGLVAVYAALSFFTLRGNHDIAVAQSLPAAASAPVVAAPVPPLAIPESAETSAAATPAPIAPEATIVAKAPEAKRSSASVPKPRVEEVSVASLASTVPRARNDALESSRSNSGSNAVSELAPTADSVASESVTSVEDRTSDQDSQSNTEAATSPNDNQR